MSPPPPCFRAGTRLWLWFMSKLQSGLFVCLKQSRFPSKFNMSDAGVHFDLHSISFEGFWKPLLVSHGLLLWSTCLDTQVWAAWMSSSYYSDSGISDQLYKQLYSSSWWLHEALLISLWCSVWLQQHTKLNLSGLNKVSLFENAE